MMSEEKVRWAATAREGRKDGHRLRLRMMVLLVGVLAVLAVLARLVYEEFMLLPWSRRCDEGWVVLES